MKIGRTSPGRLAALAAALALVLFAVAVSGCGSDDEGSGGGAAGATTEQTATAANAIDSAFVAQMIGHHEMAVEMADVAKRRGEHAEIKRLADDIITSQTAEIDTMNGLKAEFAKDGVKAGELGISEEMMGMHMDMDMLETAKPFDRTFIDMMIPHHQGAIRMARVVLAKGDSPEVEKLANAIIAAQSREIGDMNAWRKDWYGQASPAGGVPAGGEDGGSKDDSMEGMDHGG